jgi:hypothetical protein
MVSCKKQELLILRELPDSLQIKVVNVRSNDIDVRETFLKFLFWIFGVLMPFSTIF